MNRARAATERSEPSRPPAAEMVRVASARDREWGAHALWVFTIRAALAILAPVAVATAFMAFAPQFFAHHVSGIGNLATGIGVLTMWPKPFRSIWLVGTAAYVLAMWFALGLWIVFGAGPWFPVALQGLHLEL